MYLCTYVLLHYLLCGILVVKVGSLGQSERVLVLEVQCNLVLGSNVLHIGHSGSNFVFHQYSGNDAGHHELAIDHSDAIPSRGERDKRKRMAVPCVLGQEVVRIEDLDVGSPYGRTLVNTHDWN